MEFNKIFKKNKFSVFFITIISISVISNSCSMLLDLNDKITEVDDGYWGADSSKNDRAVSQDSGVAPLAVHFFSEFAASQDTGARFRNYDYTWNFDDPSSGEWGTDGKSKNIEKGALATHIFENPGEYNVTLTVKDKDGIVKTEFYTINVSDPDVFFDGENTIYVSDTSQDDFLNVPDDAIKLCTDDLSEVVGYAQAGTRILFDRGSSWKTSGLSWPSNSGPVSIGAYGTGTNPDSLGIYENAPKITVTGGKFLSLTSKQNWRISDLHLIDPNRTSEAMGGAIGIQRLLIQRIKMEGFKTSISWSSWYNSEIIIKDDIVIASCDISDTTGACIYGGSERLALLGNILEDSNYHVIRIWQAYRSVISHNIVSGSSLGNDHGKHALKLHGPGVYHNGEGSTTLGTPAPNGGLLELRTNYTIVSHNAFGSSGPWPVRIGPQNTAADERLTNIIFEYNRIHSDYGNQNNIEPKTGLRMSSQKSVIRNNIFDGTGAASEYTGVGIADDYDLIDPKEIEIYNNTIYRGDAGTGIHKGVSICSEASDIIVKNNLVSFPYATGWTTLLEDDSAETVSEANLLVDDAGFSSPDDSNPLERNFDLKLTSVAIDNGIEINVFDDFLGNSRIGEVYNIGAFE